MKKVFAVLAVAGMFAFVACGPKAEEATTETTDSAATVEAAPVVEEAAPAWFCCPSASQTLLSTH